MRKLAILILMILLGSLIITIAYADSIPTNKNVVVTEFPIIIIDRLSMVSQQYLRVSSWVTTS